MTAPAAMEVPCPKCGGKTWDNRASKKNPNAPDFKCRDRSCDGVIWPPRNGQAAPRSAAPAAPAPPPAHVRQALDLGGPIPGLDPEPSAPSADALADGMLDTARRLDAALTLAGKIAAKHHIDDERAKVSIAATIVIQSYRGH